MRQLVACVLMVLLTTLAGCATAHLGEDYVDAFTTSADDASLAAPAAGAPGGASNADRAPAQPGRLMVYDATIGLIVVDIRSAQERIRALAEQSGGYLQSLAPASVVVRVPAAQFDNTIVEIEKLGEVTAKQIRGYDVTDQMRDLELRLKNAQELHTRLVALLSLATNVTEALEIEKELARLTETIEQLKGRRQLLQNQVTFSTITVQLNSPVAQQAPAAPVPFEWVSGLAEEMSAQDKHARFYVSKGSGVACELPDGFATYHEYDWLTRAVSANGVYIKITRHKNTSRAPLSYWPELIKRTLERTRGMAVRESRPLTLNCGEPAILLDGVKQFSGMGYGYMVGISVTKRYVYVFEAWGPQKYFAQDQPALEASLKTMNTGWWANLWN